MLVRVYYRKVDRVLSPEDYKGAVYWVPTAASNAEMVDSIVDPGRKHAPLARKLKAHYPRIQATKLEDALVELSEMLLLQTRPETPKGRDVKARELLYSGLLHTVSGFGGLGRLFTLARDSKSWLAPETKRLIEEWKSTDRWKSSAWVQCPESRCPSSRHRKPWASIYWYRTDETTGKWRCPVCGTWQDFPPKDQKLPEGWDEMPAEHTPGVTH